MELRIATNKDIAGLSRCVATCWKKAYRGLVPQTYLNQLRYDFWEPAYKRWLADDRIATLCMEQNGEIIATTTFGDGRDAKLPGWAETMMVFVDPAYKGMGIGSNMLNTQLRILKKQGFMQDYVWALGTNTPAIKFYQKHGFRLSGETWDGQVGGFKVVDVRLVREI